MPFDSLDWSALFPITLDALTYFREPLYLFFVVWAARAVWALVLALLKNSK